MRDWSVAGLWRPTFPDAELVGAAADLLPAIRETGGRDATLSEKPRWEVVLSAGVIRVRTRDYAKIDRNCQRQELHRRATRTFPRLPRDFTPGVVRCSILLVENGLTSYRCSDQLRVVRTCARLRVRQVGIPRCFTLTAGSSAAGGEGVNRR